MKKTTSIFECSREQLQSCKTHFLEACSLCHKPISLDKDIFMYKGNSPYCSKECRDEQIERDEEEMKGNRRWKPSSSLSVSLSSVLVSPSGRVRRTTEVAADSKQSSQGATVAAVA